MSHEIEFVVSGKGGVGKTTTARALVDYHRLHGRSVVAIDADPCNPGLYKTYTNIVNVVARTLDLSCIEGWSALATLCSDHPGHSVVVDMPAGSLDDIKRHQELLAEVLEDLGRSPISYFVTDGRRDSVELLGIYLELTPESHQVHAVANGMHGAEHAFARYRESHAHETLLSRQGATLSLSVLAHHLCANLDWKRRSFWDAFQELEYGDQLILRAWLRELFAGFSAVRSEPLVVVRLAA